MPQLTDDDVPSESGNRRNSDRCFDVEFTDEYPASRSSPKRIGSEIARRLIRELREEIEAAKDRAGLSSEK